jgi:hypothetical protein
MGIHSNVQTISANPGIETMITKVFKETDMTLKHFNLTGSPLEPRTTEQSPHERAITIAVWVLFASLYLIMGLVFYLIWYKANYGSP